MDFLRSMLCFLLITCLSFQARAEENYSPFSSALDVLQKQINYTFQNNNLLRRAMTHPSFSEENNKALSILGAASIETCVALQCLMRDIDMSGKELNRRVSDISKVETSCAVDALRLGLDKVIRVSPKTDPTTPAVVCGAFRSIFGAIAIDGGDVGRVFWSVHRAGVGRALEIVSLGMGITLGTQPTKEEAVDGLAPQRSSCYCFTFTPFFRPHQSRTTRSSVWRRVQTLQNGEWLSRRDRGTNSMKKIQEWSGLVAGPVWKTLIRKLGRTPSHGSNRRVNFRYDLLSYSLNFDEGLRKNALLDMEIDDDIGSHNFSARFPSVPVWLRSDRLDGYSQ